jgi:hypothetical protein
LQGDDSDPQQARELRDVFVRTMFKCEGADLTDVKLSAASNIGTNSLPLLHGEALPVSSNPSCTNHYAQAPQAMNEKHLDYERGEAGRRKKECSYGIVPL